MHTFYILREFLSKKILILIYKALIEPLLKYGILVWGGAYDSNLKNLKTAQNTIVKIILKKPRLFSTIQLYNEEIIDLKTIFITTCCSHIQKHHCKQSIINHRYDTRSNINQHLIIPKINRDLSKHSSIFLAPKFYNLLPKEMKNRNHSLKKV